MINQLKIYKGIRNNVLNCKKCDLGCNLVDGHDPHVIGQGDLDADMFFIAEAPEKQETIYKKPLTPPGISGKIYENILKKLDLTRDDVYTTNIVMCRPPNNRDPEPYEIKKCSDYLYRQIILVNPRLIVTFGRFAAQAFLNNFKITKDHGKIFKSEKFGVNIFPMYHPAYYNAYVSLKRREEFKEDIVKLTKIVDTESWNE